ncbi:hypothetical protein AcV7_008546 [Taiwanofungus camphoratus]|nr:hypothetical protein AcW2_004961 [Antrodia cinnamomea]KAI0949918.1 hypothetical protein AcV7_008546 [Antrodia cinnamomea]
MDRPPSNQPSHTAPIPIPTNPMQTRDRPRFYLSDSSNSSGSSNTGSTRSSANSRYSSDLIFGPMDGLSQESSSSNHSRNGSEVEASYPFWTVPNSMLGNHPTCLRCGGRINRRTGLALQERLCHDCRARASQQVSAAHSPVTNDAPSDDHLPTHGIRTRCGPDTSRPLYGMVGRLPPALNIGPSTTQLPPGASIGDRYAMPRTHRPPH